MVKIVDNYALNQVVGTGQYGKVYKGTHIDTKLDVAIKSIDIRKFQDTSKLAECTKNQIDTLMSIQDNLNIIKFLEVIKTSNNIYLVYEYCEGGTLGDQIKKYGRLPQKQALLYFNQLMNAFKTLATNNIYHRDIKPDNILLKEGSLKLADFGFCKRMGSVEDLTQTVLGSPIYMAPQVLNGEMYNSKADIWSLGIVLFEMLFGYCPFGQGSMSQLLSHMKNFSLQIPKGVVGPCTEALLLRMIQKDSFRRLSWEDLFYEYNVSQHGVLSRKQKGFQYDLMRLIKKNSGPVSQSKTIRRTVSYKFNWEKITDRKSSVKSVQLQSHHGMGNIDQVVEMKRRVSALMNQHHKCHQASTVLVDVIRKRYTQDFGVIAYFVCETICSTINQLMRGVIDFQVSNSKYLQSNRLQLEDIQKLLLVLSSQRQVLTPKLHKLKLALCSQGSNNPQVLKFSLSPKIRNKYLSKYIQQLEHRHPTFQSMDQQFKQLDKDITVHVLKVLIALNMVNQKESYSVSQQLDKLHLVKMLHLRRSKLNL